MVPRLCLDVTNHQAEQGFSFGNVLPNLQQNTYLQTLNIDGQDSDKERMYQEPMGNEYHNREHTKLSNGSCRKERDNT